MLISNAGIEVTNESIVFKFSDSLLNTLKFDIYIYIYMFVCVCVNFGIFFSFKENKFNQNEYAQLMVSTVY